MSGLFGSTTIKGTRITDFTGTSAEVGRAIAFGYGTFPVDGFIGWAPLPPVEHRKVKRQGKGGVKQETYTYTLSYAVFFCKGPVSGFKWIKRNGKVVYTTDPNAPIEDRQYAAKWAQRVNFHWGTRDQLPDSLIESYEGVGNVSGFPYSCYITVEDEDVTDNGGAPPNYEACVIIGAAKSYTTPPYPVYIRDDLKTLEKPVGGTIIGEFVAELSVEGLSPLGGELRDVLQDYYYGDDKLGIVGLQPTGGDLIDEADPLKQYVSPPEELEVMGLEPLGGVLHLTKLSYKNYDPESLDTVGLTPLGGSLE